MALHQGVCSSAGMCFRHTSSNFLNYETLKCENCHVPCSLEAKRALAAAQCVVSTVPPVGDYDQDPVLLAAGALLGQLASEGRLRWVAYVSSTGVYGDHSGNWVDERQVP